MKWSFEKTFVNVMRVAAFVGMSLFVQDEAKAQATWNYAFVGGVSTGSYNGNTEVTGSSKVDGALTVLGGCTGCGGGSSNFTGTKSGATTLTTQVHLQPASVVHMVDYMTAGQPDGTTDNSADFAKLNGFCSATAPNTTGVTVYLDALHYKAHDVVYNCAVQFVGIHGGPGLPPTSPVVPPSGTVIDYSAATAFGFEWQPTGWPAATNYQYVNGLLVEGVSFYTTNQSASITALRLFGQRNPIVEAVDFVGENGTLIDYYGGFGGTFQDIEGSWVNGTGIRIRGDLAGETLAGAGCGISNICSTRVDVPFINHVNFAGTSSGVCFEFSGIVDTIEQQHTSCENGQNNIWSHCPTGLNNMGNCPIFFRGFDIQGEFSAGISLNLTDTTDFRCEQCYAVGAPGTNPPEVIVDLLANYAATPGTGGGFWWTNGTVYNAQGSCIETTVNDVHIVGGFIQFCNLGNLGQYGVLFNGGAGHLSVDGVTFCAFNGSPSSTANMGGVFVISSITVPVYVGPTNDFQLCNTAVTGTTQVGANLTATASGVAVASNTAKNIVSESLFPGNYECFGSSYLTPSGVVTNTITGLSTASGTVASTAPAFQSSATQASGDGFGANSGPYFINGAGNPTVFDVVFTGFTGTMTAAGQVACQRLP